MYKRQKWRGHPTSPLLSSPTLPGPGLFCGFFLAPQPGFPLLFLDTPSIPSAHTDEATQCVALLCPGTVRGSPVPRHSVSASHPGLEESPESPPISSPGLVSTALQTFLKVQPHALPPAPLGCGPCHLSGCRNGLCFLGLFPQAQTRLCLGCTLWPR